MILIQTQSKWPTPSVTYGNIAFCNNYFYFFNGNTHGIYKYNPTIDEITYHDTLNFVAGYEQYYCAVGNNIYCIDGATGTITKYNPETGAVDVVKTGLATFARSSNRTPVTDGRYITYFYSVSGTINRYYMARFDTVTNENIVYQLGFSTGTEVNIAIDGYLRSRHYLAKCQAGAVPSANAFTVYSAYIDAVIVSGYATTNDYVWVGYNTSTKNLIANSINIADLRNDRITQNNVINTFFVDNPPAAPTGTNLMGYSVGDYGIIIVVTATDSAEKGRIYIVRDVLKLATPDPYTERNTISWNAIDGATGYQIENTDTGTVYDTAANTFAVPVTGNYHVRAIDDTQTYAASDWSSVIYVVAAIPLDTPLIELDGNTLRWLVVDNATGYKIENIDTETENTTTNTYYELTAAGHYRVRAISDNPTYSDSEYSNTIIYTVALPAPILTAERKTLRWDPIAGAGDYEIRNAITGEILTTTDALMYDVEGFARYQCRALGDGILYQNSAWSNVVSVNFISVTYTVDDFHYYKMTADFAGQYPQSSGEYFREQFARGVRIWNNADEFKN